LKHSVGSLLPNGITPPINVHSAIRISEAEEDNDDRNERPAIEARASNVIILAPPSEILLSNQILEDESCSEPRGEVDTRCRGYLGDAVQEDGNVDDWETRVGVLSMPEPEGDGEDSADDESVELRIIEGMFPELATWSN